MSAKHEFIVRLGYRHELTEARTDAEKRTASWTLIGYFDSEEMCVRVADALAAASPGSVRRVADGLQIQHATMAGESCEYGSAEVHPDYLK